MTIDRRKYFFEQEIINGNHELDFLSSRFAEMKLETVDSIIIPSVMQYRGDLISFKFYRNFNFGWLIAIHNDFLDPVYDFKTGRRINIPDIDGYFRYYKAFSRSR